MESSENLVGSIPHYWINMEKRIDRRKRMEKQFDDFKVDHTRISSVPHEIPYISCILSHLKMIECAYFNGCKLAIFCEDDITLNKNLDEYFKYNKYIKDDWECFQLHYIEPRLINGLIRNRCKNRIIKGYFMSAAYYMMNRKGMEKLLNMMGKIEDEKFSPSFTVTSEATPEEFVFRYINTYTSLYPLINTLENNTSDIQTRDEDFNYNNMIAITELHKLSIDPPDEEFVTLDYHTHWFENDIQVDDFLSFNNEFLVNLNSDFANRLFQFFSVYGIARKNNGSFNIKSEAPYAHESIHGNFSYFFQNTKILKGKNNLTYAKENRYVKIKLYEEEYMKNYDYNIINVKDIKGHTIIMNGFFQNENYFKEYRQEILKIMKEPPFLTDRLNNITNYDNIVAIHIRLGDYIDKFIEKHFVNLLNYYEKCIELAKNNIKDVKFIIVSSDSKEKINAIYHVLKDIPILINKDGDELFDLYFMIRCRGVICSNSTFSWWGAWLNNTNKKFVTIPSKWLNDRDSILDMEDGIIVQV